MSQPMPARVLQEMRCSPQRSLVDYRASVQIMMVIVHVRVTQTMHTPRAEMALRQNTDLITRVIAARRHWISTLLECQTRRRAMQQVFRLAVMRVDV